MHEVSDSKMRTRGGLHNWTENWLKRTGATEQLNGKNVIDGNCLWTKKKSKSKKYSGKMEMWLRNRDEGDVERILKQWHGGESILNSKD